MSKKNKVIETLVVAMSNSFYSEVWLPLRALMPDLSVSDIIKQALQLRAMLEAVDENGKVVSVKLFHDDAPKGVEVRKFMGFDKKPKKKK